MTSAYQASNQHFEHQIPPNYNKNDLFLLHSRTHYWQQGGVNSESISPINLTKIRTNSHNKTKDVNSHSREPFI